METGGKLALKDFPIVLQANLGIVERSSEGASCVEIDERDWEFADRKAERDGLHPELERHGIAEFRDVDIFQAGNAVGLEAAKGIGESESEDAIEFVGDRQIDAATIFGGDALTVEGLEVAAAGDDVEFTVILIESGGESGDQLGLMLAIAIDGDECVVVILPGVIKSGAEGGAISLIGIMSDDVQVRVLREPFGSAVGGAVIHDKDFRAVFADLGED